MANFNLFDFSQQQKAAFNPMGAAIRASQPAQIAPAPVRPGISMQQVSETAKAAPVTQIPKKVENKPSYDKVAVWKYLQKYLDQETDEQNKNEIINAINSWESDLEIAKIVRDELKFVPKDDRPLWKKVGEQVVNVWVGAAWLATEQVWNVLSAITSPFDKEASQWFAKEVSDVKKTTKPQTESVGWQIGKNIFWAWEMLAASPKSMFTAPWATWLTSTLWGRALQAGLTTAWQGFIKPVLEKWSNAKLSDMATQWATEWLIWAASVPVIEKVVTPLVSKAYSWIKNLIGKWNVSEEITQLATKAESQALTKAEQRKLAELEVKNLSPKEKDALSYLSPTNQKISDAERKVLIEGGKLKTSKWVLSEKQKFIPDTKDLAAIKESSPIIKRKSVTEDYNLLEDAIEKRAVWLENSLKSEYKEIPIKSFDSSVKKMENDVFSQPEMFGENKKLAQRLIGKFKEFVKEEWLSPLWVERARKQFDAYVRSVKWSSVFDKNANVYAQVVHSIRNNANELAQNFVSDWLIRNALQEQSNLFHAQDMLLKQKDIGTIAKILNSRLGRYIWTWVVWGGILWAGYWLTK